jgi:hypothetical protein
MKILSQKRSGNHLGRRTDMTGRRAASLLVATAMLVGCSHKAVSCLPNEKLANLKSLSPFHAAEEAQYAFANGDRRLIGVYGMALEVPELAGNPDNYRYGIRPLEGTGDTICSDEERRLNDSARKYAQQYNSEMLSLVAKKQ